MVPMAKATINTLAKKVGTDVHIIPEVLLPGDSRYSYLNADSGATCTKEQLQGLFYAAKSTVCFYTAGNVELSYSRPTIRMPRDYDLFGILSGCRGRPPTGHPNGVCAIKDNRSWPADASEIAKDYSKDNALHDFGAISLEDMNKFLKSETDTVAISLREVDIRDLLAPGSSWRFLPGVEFHVNTASEVKIYKDISMAEALAYLSVLEESFEVIIQNKLSYAKFQTNVKKRINDGNIYPDDWGIVVNVGTEVIPLYQAMTNSLEFISLVKRLNQIAEANNMKPSDIRMLVAYDS